MNANIPFKFNIQMFLFSPLIFIFTESRSKDFQIGAVIGDKGEKNNQLEARTALIFSF
jgi:hypothetical protein